MIGILGDNLEAAFIELGIKARKTYQNKEINRTHDFGQVWEIEESDFEELCAIDEDDWKNDWGWWRHCEGSNIDFPIAELKIKGLPIKAWYNEDHLEEHIREAMEDYDHLIQSEAEARAKEDYFDYLSSSTDLLNYFCDHIGASNGKNVCAVAMDLAAINNITMAQLFEKYQG